MEIVTEIDEGIKSNFALIVLIDIDCAFNHTSVESILVIYGSGACTHKSPSYAGPEVSFEPIWESLLLGH